MKKWFTSLAFWMVVTLSAPTAALAATLSLSPSSGTFNKGCSFLLDIVLDTQGTETDGTDAILFYDPSRFSINTSSITAKTNIYPDFPGNNVDEVGGKITISGLASVTQPFSGKGTLATLQFTVKNTAPTGTTQVTFDFDSNNKAKTTDSNVVERSTIADVLNSVVNGSFVIGTGACTFQTTGSGDTTTLSGGKGGPTTFISTPSGQTNLDQLVDKEGKGPGTPELTFTLAILGLVLTVLGILGLSLL